eukprot:CAMPEP_0198259020 /NCGR_PEP_ID=MMETSP1447-20131203/8308_1 /TAXON_ID=420782 /ORGANISM="Chaetoceros dichaeta, Strain CCMP1751" /LENGTH=104 /DNA_ID=CAMNT_0043946295 /DNA_START=51 /DNA_END=365 /DNA_ORIENTATION=-
MEQENNMPPIEVSRTGASEGRDRGFAQNELGDLLSTLRSLRRVLTVREHHLGTPPFSSLRDVAIAHNDIADVLDEIILRLNNKNEALVKKYRAEAANHRILGMN